MNPIDQIWSEIRKKDAQFIREKRREVSNYKKKFLSIPTEKIKNLEEVEFFETILEGYTNLALFPDKAVLRKFKELRFNTSFLIWFVNLVDILSEFRRIEKAGNIKVLRLFAIAYIKLHLDAKIRHELIQWGGYVTTYKKDPETSLIYVSLLKLYNQRKIIRKKPIKYKDLYSKLMHGLLNQIEISFGDKYDAEKIMRDFSRGKSEGTWLKELIREAFIKDEKVSKRQFYITLYNLLRLVIKDYEMLSEAEFYKLKYNIDWDTYRYRRVEQIIDKK